VLADDYRAFFTQATGNHPYPYQEKLAQEPVASRLIHVPTGCGKTAAAVLAWLWRRKVDPINTPRRLVYCLPMRVLVEQTRDNADTWVSNLALQDRVRVHVLMGGEEADDWDLYPEREAILVGTQDMLLSRALNRGYAMSRYRWPMHFGLLHTDSLWVFDEIQLMGSGLATTAQLEAFRARQSSGVSSWWMSATLERPWLETVDYKDEVAKLPLIGLDANDDLTPVPGDDECIRQAKEALHAVWKARKPLKAARGRMGNTKALAGEIAEVHRRRRGLTLVVLNTVDRARQLHEAVERELAAAGVPLEPILIHSRFRPGDRKQQGSRMLGDPGQHGAVVISTQVVEAGVDVSARTLFTELAPWSSLVQRLGRCNRRGLDNEMARVVWIDLPDSKKDQEEICHPYDLSQMMHSRELLKDCADVSPACLEAIPFEEPPQHKWVIRRRDLVELFDTTPDLAGNDIDIDRYVRDVEESDVRVLWREWPTGHPPSSDEPRPGSDELCSVPIREFRKFVEDHERRNRAYRWDHLERRWEVVNEGRIYPGQIYLLHAETGGYKPNLGWNISLRDLVTPLSTREAEPEESNDDDRLSESDWQSIAEHTNRVCCELSTILRALAPLPQSQMLELAARWHDRGKAHQVFQDAIDDGQVVERRGQSIRRRERPPERRGSRELAKAPGRVWRKKKLIDPGFWGRYGRKHFRHELGSALAVLQRPGDGLASLSDDDLNLAAYLIAAHHGKVRLSIRSLPGEKVAPENKRFARGIWDGDELRAVDLGSGVMAPTVTLSLEPMELGLCQEPPYTGEPSWAERVLALRDNQKFGPLRLAYLEAILRAADMRASQDPDSGGKFGA
jgi:CRISPR-associated endonuclease/helicase Cas3